MTATIITKNSSTASAVPAAGSLTQGELAVNVTDKKLYTKDSGGSVVKVVGSLGNQEANAVNITGGNATLDNVTINGTLDVTNTVISNVSSPVLSSDAANKSYVDTAINNLIDSAPGTLDTLNELAAALGDDPNYAASVTSNLALKLSLSGGTMSGAIAMGGNKITGLGTPTTGTDATTKDYIDTVFGSTTSAAASAAAAAASAADAAASFDSFDDRYLGSKTSNPTVDNDGNALLTGALYWNSVAGEVRVYNGSAWVAAYLPGSTFVTLTGTETLTNKTIQGATYTGTSTFSGTMSSTGNAYQQIDTLTDGATITPDFSVGNNFSVTLGGNRTLANPTNLTAGQSGVIFITQDGTGSRTLGYGSYWDFPNSTAPTLTTTANAVDVLVYTVRSATSIAAQLITNIG